VPFVAAVAAGDVPNGIRVPLLALLGDISIGGSYMAPDGSHAGALGDDVDVLVTKSLATSMEPSTGHIENGSRVRATIGHRNARSLSSLMHIQLLAASLRRSGRWLVPRGTMGVSARVKKYGGVIEPPELDWNEMVYRTMRGLDAFHGVGFLRRDGTWWTFWTYHPDEVGKVGESP
jgi:hypothetical protein